jgi:MHS family proline/betaine transporter-like MFS transporter
MIPSFLAFLLIPFAGYLSDIWGRKKIILLGQTGLIVLAPFAFEVFANGVFFHILLVQVGLSLFFALSCGPTAALLTEMFPVRLRNTGMAMSYHLATGVFGGFTPLILTSLTSALGIAQGSTIMVTFAGIIGLMTLAGIKETRESQLMEVRC